MQQGQRVKKSNKASEKSTVRYSNAVKCFNCGGLGHLSRDCKNEKRVITCYLCKRPGHMMSRCANYKPSGSRYRYGVNFCSTLDDDGCYSEDGSVSYVCVGKILCIVGKFLINISEINRKPKIPLYIWGPLPPFPSKFHLDRRPVVFGTSSIRFNTS